MGFSIKIKDEILVASARHCSVCHQHKGNNIEVHHIIPKHKGGEDVAENAIALCFDCHADAGHYYAMHPKGMKLSPTELRKHKENWLEIVFKNNIQTPNENKIELTIVGGNSDVFTPKFIEHVTKFSDRNSFKEILTFSKFDFKKELKRMKSEFSCFSHTINKIKSIDDYIDFLSDDSVEKNIDKNNDIQPIEYNIKARSGRYYKTKTINLSICVLDLKLTNLGPDAIEDYKLYLNFENVVKADSVGKWTEYLDTAKYTYNVHFKDDFNAEYIPKSPILVQDDSVDIDRVCFKTGHKKSISYINWKILARNFSKSGRIELKINPIVETEEYDKYVDNPENFETIKRIKCKYD